MTFSEDEIIDGIYANFEAIKEEFNNAILKHTQNKDIQIIEKAKQICQYVQNMQAPNNSETYIATEDLKEYLCQAVRALKQTPDQAKTTLQNLYNQVFDLHEYLLEA